MPPRAPAAPPYQPSLACLLVLLACLARVRAQTAQADYILPGSLASLTASALDALYADWTPFNYLTANVTALSDITVTAVACQAGTYTPANSQTCTSCPKGTYSDKLAAPDASTCLACPSGTYSDKLGVTSPADCTTCPSNTYYEGTGGTSQDNCQACPANTNSNQPQLRQNCICNDGYTGPGGEHADFFRTLSHIPLIFCMSRRALHPL